MKHTHNCGRTGKAVTLSCKLSCKCRCHHPLYRVAKNVVASWEGGDLAEAVRQLARSLREFESSKAGD